MRSKTSFFHKTLFQKNLSRYWPLWTAAAGAGALAPVTLLLQLARMGDVGLGKLDMAQAYYAVLEVAVPVISLLYAVLCAAAVWSYLYNPRSTGMMHRLPIRREGLFATGFLSGMAMMLIPYVVTGALTLLMTCLAGAPAWKAMGVTVAGVLAESFFYFASATFAAFLTGNLFAMPVLYFLLHFLQPLLSFLVGVLQSGFYYGVPGGYSPALEWLCPTVYLISNVDVNSQRTDVAEVLPSTGEHIVRSELVDVTLENGRLIGAYALAGAVLLALAWLLYRRRASEQAGDVAAVGWLRPVFRYGGALLAGIGGGMLLYEIVWQPFQKYYETYELLPLLVCVLICGLVGYYGVSMLLDKSLKVFRGSLGGAVLAVVLLAALVGAVRADLFGVEKRVPAENEIESAQLWIEGEKYELLPGNPLLSELVSVHQTIVDQLDDVREDNRRIHQGEGLWSYTYLNVNYQLADGRKLHRDYSLCFGKDELAREGSYVWKLDRFVNSPMAKQNRLQMDEEVTHLGGQLHDRDYKLEIALLPAQTEALREAVARDAENGNWGSTYWFEDQRGEEFANMDIWMTAQEETEDGRPSDRNVSTNLYIIIRPEMTETVAELRRQGLLEQDSLTLIDSAQGQGTPGAAPISDREITVEEIELIGANGEDSAMGVIGGADGPTTVFVTGG